MGKEEMLTMLEHIQHYCHERWNCDKCAFGYNYGAIKRCVFCGVLTIDCYPPEKWDLRKLREMLVNQQKGVQNEKILRR